MIDSLPETFQEFRKSFSYGSRSDLLFKFLGSDGLTDKDAADFFQGLLRLLGSAFDTGNYEYVMEYCFNWQVRAYKPKTESSPGFSYDTTPWTPLVKPLTSCRVALLSTAGVYRVDHDPLGPDGPTQEDVVANISDFLKKPPVWSGIPSNFNPDDIRVRHPGYDVRGAERDYNCVFPIDRLRELEQEGVFMELAPVHYSFVGATSQKRLLLETAPEWASLLHAQEVDAVVLVAL